jgi:hypothetical protein
MRRLLTRGVAIAAVVAVVLGVAAVPVFASVGVTVGSAARSFSPNGDGQEDTVDVTCYLAEASNLDTWNVMSSVKSSANASRSFSKTAFVMRLITVTLRCSLMVPPFVGRHDPRCRP